MSILLDDKEIIKNINLDKERTYIAGQGTYITTFDTYQLLQAQLRKVAEWMDKPCDNKEHGTPYLGGFYRYQCYDCMRTLLKEAGLKE